MLIVASAYAPAMAADMQRARQLAWELPKLGWDVEIIAPGEAYQNVAYIDDDSLEFFAPETSVHELSAFLPRIFRLMRIGTIGWRAFLPLLWKGTGLLRSGRFDLVYFSTTSFVFFVLGPVWKKFFGIPFVLDIHDPIYNAERTHPVWAKPGMRHRLARHFTRVIERWSVPRADAIIAVSPQYIAEFQARYAARDRRWQDAQAEVIPFAVLPNDSAIVKDTSIAPPGGKVAIRYAGVGGPVMRRSFALLCDALARIRSRGTALLENVQIELYGTHMGWKSGEPCILADIARERGVGDLVIEKPTRVSFRRSLELLTGSNGCLILGVDDSGYMASKLYSYAYSGKPLLAAVRKDGAAFAAVLELGGTCRTIWFDENSEMPPDEAADAMAAFLADTASARHDDRSEILASHSAASMARRHADLFDRVISGQSAA